MVEPGLQSKKLFVQFDGAMNKVVVWINGKKAAEDEGGYLPLVIDITNLVDFGKENTIAVRLDNTDNPVTGPKPLVITSYSIHYTKLYEDAKRHSSFGSMWPCRAEWVSKCAPTISRPKS